jgi:hypothetical protein
MQSGDEGSRENALREFNKTLAWLVNLLIKLNPNDVEVERIKGQMMLAKGADREILIRECGPYLFKYQNYIYTRNEDFLLRGSPAELERLEPTARLLVDKIREQYARMKQAEKDQIYNKITVLLSSYLEFLLHDSQ